MLDEKTELVMAKLIGLLNGMDEFLPEEDIKKDIPKILLAVKEKRDYEESIEALVFYKNKYLSNCNTCKFPCGRTSDYHLNQIENEEKRKSRETELLSYLDSFTGNENFNDIVYHIGKLGW